METNKELRNLHKLQNHAEKVIKRIKKANKQLSKKLSK
jgi:hypothetical protein